MSTYNTQPDDALRLRDGIVALAEAIMQTVGKMQRQSLRRIIREELSMVVPENIGKNEFPNQMTHQQAVEYLTSMGHPITRATLYRLSSTGGIPYSKCGKRNIYSRQALDSWIAENLQKVEPQQDKMRSIISQKRSMCKDSHLITNNIQTRSFVKTSKNKHYDYDIDSVNDPDNDYEKGYVGIEEIKSSSSNQKK